MAKPPAHLFGPSVPVKDANGVEQGLRVCTALAILNHVPYQWHFLKEVELRELVQQPAPSFKGVDGIEALKVLYYRACKGPEGGWKESSFTHALADFRAWLIAKWGEAKVLRLERLIGVGRKVKSTDPREIEEAQLMDELLADEQRAEAGKSAVDGAALDAADASAEGRV